MTTTPSPARTASVLVGVSLALGLLFDWLFFAKMPGVSVVIFVAVIVGGLVALSSYLKRPLPVSARWLLLPLGVFAAMVAVRASYLLSFLNVVASLILLLLIARLTLADDLRRFNLFDYAKIVLLPLSFLLPLVRTLGSFFAVRTAVTKHSLAGQILRGALLAAPLLIVFIILFGSADLVFQHYLAQAFTFRLDQLTIIQIIIVGLVTLGFTGAYSYIFQPRPDKQASSAVAQPASLVIGKVEMNVLLGSVNTLFFLFILVQLAYLFGGLGNISGDGFTYAEYARKGFFELLLVALVSFGLLWGADKTSVKTPTGHSLVFRILSGVLIAQVMLIMVSAFKRLYLYEQAFGFTTLRLYSHIFVIFLAVVFALLLVKIMRNQVENHFALPVFLTAIIFLAGLNLLNPDAFIARQNLDRFHQTGKLDAYYIGGLSDDANSQMKAAVTTTTGQTKQALIDSAAAHPTSSHWQSWNLARSRAGR